MQINETIVANYSENRIFVRKLYNKLATKPRLFANLFLVSMYVLTFFSDKKFNYSFVYKYLNS